MIHLDGIQPEGLLSISLAARILRVERSYVTRMMKAGKLLYFMRGERVCIPRRNLSSLIDGEVTEFQQRIEMLT